jgi:hypothetical protein
LQEEIKLIKQNALFFEQMVLSPLIFSRNKTKTHPIAKVGF